MNQSSVALSASGRYDLFYTRLLELREVLHGVGRFDDANSKLDELCRLFVLKVLDQRYPTSCGRSRLSPAHLADIAGRHFGDARCTAAALHMVFHELAAADDGLLREFGPRPELRLDEADDAFADALLPVIEALPVSRGNGQTWSFDIFNEAFGHFIHGSFRHRKEDAQYLTPPEVVSAMARVAIHDLLLDESARDAEVDEPLLIADPTCGVGSFLAAIYCQACQTPFRDGCLSDHLRLFGQDKIDRMVRLANVSVRMLTDVEATIRQGNSVSAGSLADIAGRVDLILTNPPFGASFAPDQLLSPPDESAYPILTQLARQGSLPRSIDSEFALLDRELALLRPGGRMLMVVPDKVVSGGGFAAALRSAVLQHAQLVAVFDLPTETFAQAGTRTKTSVVYLRKFGSPEAHRALARQSVFMATADDLGYRVASRTGVTVKRLQGSNQLEAVADQYLLYDAQRHPATPFTSLSDDPPISAVADDALLNGRWNASFYRGTRLRALRSIAQLKQQHILSRPLCEVVEIDPDHAERVTRDEQDLFISVLHVGEDGFVDLRAMDGYAPSTPGVRCRPDDVLLSRINPRIMRVCVVPRLARGVACSAEFAVMRCRAGELNPWMLTLIMRTDWVQSQIRSLTSGTSSSHNRIKSPELRSVMLPVPEPDSPAHHDLRASAERYRQSLDDYYAAVRQAMDCFTHAHEALGKRDEETAP